MAKEKSILTLHQQSLLKAIASQDYFCKRYYFAGGTALSEFYLKHRISEDLDFFLKMKKLILHI